MLRNKFSWLLSILAYGTWSIFAQAMGGDAYLTFSSTNEFSIGTVDGDKSWDGTLRYSTDGEEWTVWDGETIVKASKLSGTDDYVILFRGEGNSKISGGDQNSWVLNGVDISCSGNIETLLDYDAVDLGVHPVMSDKCFDSMFANCTNLLTTPTLPAVTLSKECYHSMFQGCTALTDVPTLPGTNLEENCYSSMFNGCTGITFDQTTGKPWGISSDAVAVGSNWNSAMFGIEFQPAIGKTYYISSAPDPEIEDSWVTLSWEVTEYTGIAQKPNVIVTNVSTKAVLTEGTHYVVTYSDDASTEVGTYTVTIEGTNTYAGKVEKSYTIRAVQPKMNPSEGVMVVTNEAESAQTAIDNLKIVAPNGSGVKDADYKTYFTITALEVETGKFELIAKLDDESKIAMSVTIASLATNLMDIAMYEEGATNKISIAVKPGLWYGVDSKASMISGSEFAPGEKSLAKADTLLVPVSRPSAEAGFFRISVDVKDSSAQGNE